MKRTVDVLIVGGGIAGVSLAAALSASTRVGLVEAEQHLGTHATGRSAALLVEAYGPAEIRTLTGLSRSFFESPPAGFSDAPLASRRGAMIYAGERQVGDLRAEFELAGRSTRVEWLEADEVLARCPLLRPRIAEAALLEPDALDLDTNALLQGFARLATRNGAVLFNSAPVATITRIADGWLVSAGEHEISCGILVDAAGAWADRVASMARVTPCGLEPRRRTAATLPVPAEQAAFLADTPFVAPVDGSYYFKPDAGAMLVSLSEETPSDPCDAFADDIDVATALELFHEATVVPRARPIAAWAGLRTFVPDRKPVVGFDAGEPGFFWYAGQGGYGIQTSPALSALGAKLILGAPLATMDASLAAALDPARMRGG